MTGSDAINNTADDHRRLKTGLLAQDQATTYVSTADVDETTARCLVGALLEDDVVIPDSEQRVLVHEPRGEAFDSIWQLAVFHRGWTAARDSGEEDK
ncbi:hypothetical protein [Natrialba sp. SSL1]|uniref:hypothetical protein n=1 Tax=Natrialba sp. SSL1 TaxID=1869245 RepID=UPI0008F94895|nr:hypothetical protein [Natrialba sp. SSL1]OIB57413.1 hypothetical protein BBD46_02225 [Natrialba sp. SSL1]